MLVEIQGRERFQNRCRRLWRASRIADFDYVGLFRRHNFEVLLQLEDGAFDRRHISGKKAGFDLLVETALPDNLLKQIFAREQSNLRLDLALSDFADWITRIGSLRRDHDIGARIFHQNLHARLILVWQKYRQ